MAISTVKSENITNIEASPIVALDRKRGTLKTCVDQDAIATTSIDEVGDVMLFGPVPSNAVLVDVLHLNDDLDGNGTPLLAVDVGLYYSGIGGTQTKLGNTSGTVIDADCFSAANAGLQAPVKTWTSVRFATDDITDVKLEAWAVGGLAADPGGLLYIGLTVSALAATAAAGDVVIRTDYI